MATDTSFMQYVAEQIDLGGRLSYRKMFGEYAVYLDKRSSRWSATTACSSSPPRRPQRLRRSCRSGRLTLAQSCIR